MCYVMQDTFEKTFYELEDKAAPTHVLNDKRNARDVLIESRTHGRENSRARTCFYNC